MKYWFIFVKDAVMLEKNADGSRTIPMAENPPIELKPWTHVMEIAPMEDGTEVRAASMTIPSPRTNATRRAHCASRSIICRQNSI